MIRRTLITAVDIFIALTILNELARLILWLNLV
jgi:hypothetical protein